MAKTQSSFPSSIDTVFQTDRQTGDIVQADWMDYIEDAIYEIENWINDGSGNYSFDGQVTINESGADKDFRIEGVGQPNALFVQGSDGKVGIGTNSPSEMLHVVSTDREVVVIEGSSNLTTFGGQFGQLQLVNTDSTDNNYVRLSFSDGASADAVCGIGAQITSHTDDYGELVFWTRGSGGFDERVRIDSAGNVGIGKAPSEALDVNGNITASGTIKAGGAGVIGGDGTGGRILRASYLRIDNGTNASTLKCQLYSRWNGDAIAETDNIAKGATTGHFTLSSDGQTLKIEASGLSGNAIYSLGTIYGNYSTTDLIGNVRTESNDLVVRLRNSNTGANEDMTVLVDTGLIYVEIFYITDA